ncbi:hypothetical protein [Candidatus Binatus sp.]|uniref:hypothetical protein n=1 Tax=Candidatus Binatus sp. TaxID=2811406 RepID=UPI003C936951
MKRPAESFANGIPQADALRATQLALLQPSDRDGIRDILGQVWYANLLLWVNGRIPVSRLYENMETACRLLISHNEA